MYALLVKSSQVSDFYRGPWELGRGLIGSRVEAAAFSLFAVQLSFRGRCRDLQHKSAISPQCGTGMSVRQRLGEDMARDQRGREKAERSAT